MSGGQFWNDEENDFRDIPDEVNQESAPPPMLPPQSRPAQPTRQRPARPAPAPVVPAQEEIQIEGLDEDDDYTVVLSDARLRLEQGRLYEMIMNHDIFDGVNADTKAIKSVQREIRKFAKERMEIMLGMRQEQLAQATVNYQSPFNDMEVTVLKLLASKASKGATESTEQRAPVEPPKPDGIRPISGGQKPSLAAPKPIGVKPSLKAPVAAPAQKLPSKPATAVERPKAQQNPNRDLGMELEEENYKPLEKPIHKMTEDELIDRNRQATERQAKAKAAPPANAVPIPTYEQQEMLYTQRMVDNAPAVGAIMQILNNQKKQ